MKKCLAIAALLLASTAAQAQYTIEYGGRTIRIDPDRGTVSIPGVYDNTGRPSKRSKTEDNDRSSKQTPQQAKTDPKTDPQTAPAAAPAPAPAEQAAAPATPAPPPAPAATAQPSATTAAVAPADTATAPPAPQASPDIAPPPAKPAPAPTRRRGASGTSAGTCPCHRSGRQFAAWRLADRGEGRQGPDRAMRRQSVRLCRRQEVEPEWRAGADQHEARQGQMERPDTRSEQRQHLRFHDRAERLRHLARPGLRLWRRVLRRPDLDAGQLSGCPLR